MLRKAEVKQLFQKHGTPVLGIGFLKNTINNYSSQVAIKEWTSGAYGIDKEIELLIEVIHFQT